MPYHLATPQSVNRGIFSLKLFILQQLFFAIVLFFLYFAQLKKSACFSVIASPLGCGNPGKLIQEAEITTKIKDFLVMTNIILQQLFYAFCNFLSGPVSILYIGGKIAVYNS